MCTLFVMMGSALATPEEDYEKGYEAYHGRSDIFVAMNYFKKAADADHVEAMMLLAHILYRSNENKEALKWYERADTLGNVEATYNLGLMHMGGEGTKKDAQKGTDLIVKAATNGNSNAMVQVARWYEGGALGLTQSNKVALSWLVKAIKLDNFSAMEILADSYKTGRFGLKVNPKKAKTWDEKAVETRASELKKAGKKE